MTAQTIAHGIALAVFQMSMVVLLMLGLVLVVLFIMQGFENAANERARQERLIAFRDEYAKMSDSERRSWNTHNNYGVPWDGGRYW